MSDITLHPVSVNLDAPNTQQQRSELLTFGYVSRMYNSTIPMQLIKLMQLFYDEWIHLNLSTVKLKEFMETENRKAVYTPKTSTIKGIEFGIISYPNGMKFSEKGLVVIGVGIMNFPTDIEYCEFYLEIKCEQLNDYVYKKLCKTMENGDYYGDAVCQLSELKDITAISFDYMINIQCIKYKTKCDKINYYSPINTMRNRSQFTWNINGLLLQTCQRMLHRQCVHSNNFDNNNWCVSLYPNGYKYEGNVQIYIKCLHFPHDVESMDVKLIFDVNGIPVEGMQTLQHDTVHHIYAMTYFEFKKLTTFRISVTLEIINIFDENNEIIEKSCWEKLGISID